LRWSELSGGEVLGFEASEILAFVGSAGLDYLPRRPQLQEQVSQLSGKGYDLSARTYR
jgi:hypothetical protein